MPFENLREFISAIEKRGELLRVTEKVSPILEITEWADRTVKKKGPALFFENIEGSNIPVAINLFGTLDRTSLGLGVKDLNEIGNEIEALLQAQERQIEKAQSDIAVLRAELGFLTRPERLEPLARQYLGMQPATAAQIVRIEELPTLVRKASP